VGFRLNSSVLEAEPHDRHFQPEAGNETGQRFYLTVINPNTFIFEVENEN
jgi:hypothetical protein